MACYRVTAKTFMFCMGLIFWAVAGGLFYMGGYIFYSHGHIDEIATSKFVLVPASIILLVGLLILVVGIVGCLAVCTESRCLLATFFTILTAIFALLVAACALSIFYNKDDALVHKITDGWAKGFSKYSSDTNWKDEIDYIQGTFKCCGLNNATDWLDAKLNPAWAKKHVKQVPASCCNTTKDTCSLDDAIDDAGCVSFIVSLFKDNLVWIYSVAAGLAALLLIGMLASGAVMCTRTEGGCVCCAGAAEENYETLNEDAAPTGGRGVGLRV